MKKPRLSYYSYDSLRNPWVSGGGAVRDFEVLRRIAWDADVTLFVGKYPGFRAETRENIRIRGLGFGNRNAVCRLTYSLAANLRILFDTADIIGNSASIYAPVLTGLLRGRRFYAVYHHYVGRRSLEKFGWLGILPRLLEQLMLRGGKSYVVSNATLADQIQRGNSRARVFKTFNGFDPGLLALAHEPSSPPFVLYLGRFDIYMKGLDLLLPVFAEAAAPKGVDLVLAGRGSEEAVAKVRGLIPESARSRVRFELDISETRKAELLASCLFFCSPSRFEGFGIAALEANAAGKAALVTDTDGFRESLALGRTALAVPPEDASALRAGIIRLIEDAGEREELGRQGRARASAFSWDSIAKKEWEWISGLLKSAHLRP